MPNKKELRAKKKELRHKKRQQEKKRSQAQYAKKLLGKIRLFDDPILSMECDAVSQGDDMGFIALMKKVLSQTKTGVGLAAPQIGTAKRVCVLRFDPESNVMKVMVNPRIISEGELVENQMEGCLSYPNVTTWVYRAVEITVEYLDENFKAHQEKFKNFRARVIQHEIDHLNGICKVGEQWKKEQSIEAAKAAQPEPETTPVS